MSFRIDDILKKDNKLSNETKPFKNDRLEITSEISLNNRVFPSSYLNYDCLVQYYNFNSFQQYRTNFCFEKYCQNFSEKPEFYSYPCINYCYSRRKGGQVRFTTNQTDTLEKRFNCHKYLSPEDRKILAGSLQLTDRQVKTWFQNRRAKWRRSLSSNSQSDSNEQENRSK